MWRVALTFDTEHADQPYDASATEQVFDVLRQREVRATAFIQGRWADAFPEVARRIADDGHVVGNHSYFHADMRLFSPEGRRNDIAMSTAAVEKATGVDPRPWFRCPFGRGSHDEDVLRDISDSGYREVRWNVQADDWEPDQLDIVDRVVTESAGQGDGAVVLLHPWTNATVFSIAAIIDRLRAEGATLVGIDELDDLP